MRIAIIFAFIMCALSFGGEPLPRELQGDKIPAFTAIAPDNIGRLTRTGLANEAKKHKAKRVVLSLFATWCVNCRGEFSQLKNNSGKLKEKGVLVYLINEGESLKDEEGEKVRKFVEDNAGSSFPFYFDQDISMLKSFGFVSIADKNTINLPLPVIVVMDSDLRVLGVFMETGDDFPQVLWGDL